MSTENGKKTSKKLHSIQRLQLYDWCKSEGKKLADSGATRQVILQKANEFLGTKLIAFEPVREILSHIGVKVKHAYKPGDKKKYSASTTVIVAQLNQFFIDMQYEPHTDFLQLVHECKLQKERQQ